MFDAKTVVNITLALQWSQWVALLYNSGLKSVEMACLTSIQMGTGQVQWVADQRLHFENISFSRSITVDH